MEARAPHLDVTNRHCVATMKMGGGERRIVVANPPRALTKAEALIYAAWIVVLAETLEPHDVTFDEARRLVEES